MEGEKEVKPPVSIGHIQWLDMHDWKERQVANETEYNQWYQTKLAEIIAVVESEESRRFSGEIKDLEHYLKPISSDTRISQLLKKPLIGRVWLRDAVEKWRNDKDRSSRLFWIMGDPGVGKSAFIANLLHYGRDKVIAAEFCDWKEPFHQDASRIVRTLAFQIATRLPDYRKFLMTLPEIHLLDGKNSSELFEYLLTNPLKLSISEGRERYLIIIDALDEAGINGRNELVDMLARYALNLPAWIGLIVTSRPEKEVIIQLKSLDGLNPKILDTRTESNCSDIHEYLQIELATNLLNNPNADHVVEQILEKSEGVFLYIERFCHDFQLGHISLDHPKKFPQGLGGIFLQYFQRQFPDKEKYEEVIEPSLGAILAAREPLPVEILQKLFGWRETELRKWLRTLGSLFPVTTEAGIEVIKPYHKSLADWLRDEAKTGAHFVSTKDGHRMLADSGFRCCADDCSKLPHYFLKHLSWHLLASERFEQLLELLNNSGFLSQTREKGVVVDVLECCADVLDTTSFHHVGMRRRFRRWMESMPEHVFAVRFHENWCGLMKQQGYCFGPNRNDVAKKPTHPLIVSWEKLSKQHQVGGWRNAHKFFSNLHEHGLGIRPASEKPNVTEWTLMESLMPLVV